MENPKKKGWKTAKTRNDTAVQGTNDSSIVSKCSAAALGYTQDDYTQYMVAKTSRRAPLINRGYYIRAQAVDFVYKAFLNHYPAGKQVLNLGAGFDVAFFKFSSQDLLDNTAFFEVDFTDVMTRKLSLIKQNEPLNRWVNGVRDNPSTEIVLDSANYKMLGVDLTNVPLLNATLKAAGFDPSKPTLVVSEVVLTYMLADRSSSVIRWAAQHIDNAVFVTYEQVNPDDGFGKFMLKHFDKIGSTLRTIHKYPTLPSQITRYNQLGWSHVQGQDMNHFLHNVLPLSERLRMMPLEPFDEFEEWHLKCAHYILLTAYRGICEGFADVLWSQHIGPNRDGRSFQGFKDSRLVDTVDDLSRLPVVPPALSDTVVDLSRLPVVPPACFNDSQGECGGENGVHVKRFGHTVSRLVFPGDSRSATAASQQYLLVIGGFGESDSHHGRVKRPLVVSVDSHGTQVRTAGTEGLSIYERMYHTATVLQDGCRVVVFGGRLSPTRPCLTTDLLQYTEMDEALTVTHRAVGRTGAGCDTDLTPEPRWRHSAVAVVYQGQEHVVVYGGRSERVAAYSDCFMLSVNQWTWSAVPPSGRCPPAIHSHSADVWNGCMVISGGLDEYETPQSSLYTLTLETGTWRRLDIAMRSRYCHCSAVCGHQLFLVGGVSDQHPPPGLAVIHLSTLAVQEYSWPISDWSNIRMVHNHQAALLDNKLVILGGGGNCFSFGTHLNDNPFILNLGVFGERAECMEEKC